MINNENKKLSRNRKTRNERIIKMADKTKLLLIKIKSEKKKRMKNLDKTKHLEIELVKTKNTNTPNKIQSELKTN